MRKLLIEAKNGNEDAIEEVINQYKPLIISKSETGGYFNEDLYSILVLQLLYCIQRFVINEKEVSEKFIEHFND
jgi:DNA-directed RNA polymerase specialized sigma subunit